MEDERRDPKTKNDLKFIRNFGIARTNFTIALFHLSTSFHGEMKHKPGVATPGSLLLFLDYEVYLLLIILHKYNI